MYCKRSSHRYLRWVWARGRVCALIGGWWWRITRSWRLYSHWRIQTTVAHSNTADVWEGVCVASTSGNYHTVSAAWWHHAHRLYLKDGQICWLLKTHFYLLPCWLFSLEVTIFGCEGSANRLRPQTIWAKHTHTNRSWAVTANKIHTDPGHRQPYYIWLWHVNGGKRVVNFL